MPDEKQLALLSRRRGMLASKIKDPVKKKEFIARQGMMSGKVEQIEMETSQETNRQALTSYKRGGKVKKTGPAMLHKGERVLPATHGSSYDFRKQKGRRAPVRMSSTK